MEAMNNKKIHAPELRFKRFEEGWEVKSMGDLGSFMGGGTPATSVEKYWIGDIPWISSSDLFEDDLQNINIHRYLNQEAITESATKVIPKNSVLLISRVGVGKLAINKTELCTSQDFSNFIPNECDSYFVGYFLLARKNLLINFAQGTSIKGFTTSDIKSLKVSIPSLPEQQKIASFLSAVDEKIQQFTRKKELLEQYKKGVMQQLFSGKLRFKDENGKAFPKWEGKKLGAVCEMTSSKRVYLSDYVAHGIPFYRGKEITELKNNQSPSDILYITELRYEDYKLKYGVPQKDDILITAVGTLGNVLRIKNNSKFYFKDGNLIWLRNIKLNPEYLEVLIEWNKPELIKTSIGSTQRALTMVELRKININVPCLEEQKMIANYLSDIDNKIEIVNKQITQTQTFKKGLLQQMFV